MNDDTTNTTDREDASDLQQWIDGLLRSIDAAELEAAPSTTRAAATSAIKQLRRYQKRRLTLAVFASAAAITAIAMWPNTPLPRREGATENGRPESTERRAVVLAERSGAGLATPLVHHNSDARATIENPSPSPSLQGRGINVVARFETNGETIAIPLASDDPQVSIVKLYPTTTTERRWRREVGANATSSEPNGG